MKHKRYPDPTLNSTSFRNSAGACLWQAKDAKPPKSTVAGVGAMHIRVWAAKIPTGRVPEPEKATCLSGWCFETADFGRTEPIIHVSQSTSRCRSNSAAMPQYSTISVRASPCYDYSLFSITIIHQCQPSSTNNESLSVSHYYTVSAIINCKDYWLLINQY